MSHSNPKDCLIRQAQTCPYLSTAMVVCWSFDEGSQTPMRKNVEPLRKRIQRRMSASSLASLQKPNIRRQYLVRVKEPGPWFIMSPSSKQRFVWDCIALLAVFYELCVTPLHLYRLENDIRYYADVGHWAMTIFWLLDIPATFLTAVYINDHLRFHVKDIAKAYAKSWLCFDLHLGEATGYELMA